MDDPLLDGLVALKRRDFGAARRAFEAATGRDEGTALFHLGLLASNGQGVAAAISSRGFIWRCC